MDSRFIESVFAEPPVILGRKLRPFCCGHAVILDALDSHYLTGGDITPAELICAVWVCSQSFEEGRRKVLMGNAALKAEWEEWGKSVMSFDFPKSSRAMNDYLEQHIRAPEKWKKKGGTSATKAPWPLVVVTALMMDFKMSAADAWNMTLPEALWYFAALAERNGDNSLVTDQDRERQRIAQERAQEASNG